MTATLYSDGRLAITGSGLMKNWASASAVDWYSKRNTITKVTFDGDIQSIGAYAFSGCGSLSDCVLPDSVSNIGQYAFLTARASRSSVSRIRSRPSTPTPSPTARPSTGSTAASAFSLSSRLPLLAAPPPVTSPSTAARQK